MSLDESITEKPTYLPNYIVIAYLQGLDTPGPFYYVPQAKTEEHAINQVREYLFRIAGIKAPYDPTDPAATLKILRFNAIKIKNDTIQAL